MDDVTALFLTLDKGQIDLESTSLCILSAANYPKENSKYQAVFILFLLVLKTDLSGEGMGNFFRL